MKLEAYDLKGKRLHVEPTKIIRFSGSTPLQTFLIFSGSSTQTVQITMKFKPDTNPCFRPRLQRFYL